MYQLSSEEGVASRSKIWPSPDMMYLPDSLGASREKDRFTRDLNVPRNPVSYRVRMG